MKVKIFLKKKKNKSDNMVVNFTKISQNMKNKSFLGIDRTLQNRKKCYIII